jgi:hypothetical protein
MPQSNLTATSNPTVNDDVTLGYHEGSLWVTTATGFVFVLADPSAGAADWQQVYPVGLRITTITTDTTLTTSHTIVLCDTTSRAFTVTLPTAVGNEERVYFIKNIGSPPHPVTIDPNAAETIDGGLTAVISRRNPTVMIVSDGSNWRIV